MPKKSETYLKERVLRELQQLGGWWVKVQQITISGTPDILGCYKGHFVALELKSEEGVISRLQNYNLRKIESSGGYAASVLPSTWEVVKHEIQMLGEKNAS